MVGDGVTVAVALALMPGVGVGVGLGLRAGLGVAVGPGVEFNVQLLLEGSSFAMKTFDDALLPVLLFRW